MFENFRYWKRLFSSAGKGLLVGSARETKKYDNWLLHPSLKTQINSDIQYIPRSCTSFNVEKIRYTTHWDLIFPWKGRERRSDFYESYRSKLSLLFSIGILAIPLINYEAMIMKYACIQVCRLAFLHSIALMSSSYMSTLFSFFFKSPFINLLINSSWSSSGSTLALFPPRPCHNEGGWSVNISVVRFFNGRSPCIGEEDSLSKNP